MTNELTRQQNAGSGVSRFVIAFFGAFAVWLLLTGSLAGQELLAGVVVALLVTAISWPHLALYDGVRLTPLLPLHLARYLAGFLFALVLANLDMARRVLSPRLPIDPEIVEVRTGLQSRLGRLMLANSITLTPGTLTVDVRGEVLEVHWIDASPGRDPETVTRAIAGDFEKLLGAFLR